MFNKKAILINGYSRGGTNILWNILQSHPKICSARYETKTIFKKRKLFISKIIAVLKKANAIENKFSIRLIDYGLYRIKMTNYKHYANKYVTPNKLYERNQVGKSSICFKSVDEGIYYTDLLLKIYPELFIISLVRNGYALAEGHLRRGSSIEQIAKLYQKIADEMKMYSNMVNRFKLVKFEDVITNPFLISEQLFQFTESEPYDLTYLRLKSKKVVKVDGNHEINFGEEKMKYWFDKESVWDLIDPTINDIQIKNLSNQDIKEFNKYASSALSYFGYEVL